MLILAVDTSCCVASAALIRDGVCVCEKLADTSKKHAETVLPLVEETLEACGVSVTDVELFAVDIGPGSFTGVRIGVSAVNAMAYAVGKQVVPVDALRALYEPYANTTERICSIIDAGNGNAYAAQYQSCETLCAPEAVVTQAYLASLEKGTRIVGDIADDASYPSAACVGLAANRRIEQAADEARPLYLRASQAERMWKLRQEAKSDGR